MQEPLDITSLTALLQSEAPSKLIGKIYALVQERDTQTYYY